MGEMENFFATFFVNFCQIDSHTQWYLNSVTRQPKASCVWKELSCVCEAGPGNFAEKSGKNIKYMSRMQEIALEVDQLKQQLREREREREQLWSGWFWLWILIPLILIIVVIMKVSKGNKLDSEIRSLRERIQNLERAN